MASIPSVYFRVARDLGIEGWALLRDVTLPATAPQVITTLRVAAGLSWLVVVAAEMIAGRDGLGFAVWDARNGLRIDLLAAERERRGAPGARGPPGLRVTLPHQLSGGMRQRVELARALGGETDLLLMDEPFSSLDYLTRLRMRGELARLLREVPRTVVLVTHDIEEAAQLADLFLVLGERPSRVRDEVRLTAPRPRDATQAEVVRAVHHILSGLGLESAAAPRAAAGPDGTR